MTRANRGNERGFVLVAVLWSLAILTILTWGFARRALIDRRAAALSVDHVQARFMARGAVERAVAEMRNQAMLDHFARNYDAMVEAGQVPDYGRLTFGNFLWRDHPDLLKGNDVFASAGGDAFEGDTCSFEITDCESRICVSTAPEDLLEELPDLSFRTINAILERRGEGGGEGAEKVGQGFSAIEEVRSLEDVDDRTWFGGEDVPGLRDLLTVWGDGRINLNTAPVEVLRCIPGLDESVIDFVLAFREGEDGELRTADDRVFDSQQELRLVAADLNVSADRLTPLVQYCKFESDFYTIRGYATQRRGKVRAECAAVVRMQGGMVSVLEWRETARGS